MKTTMEYTATCFTDEEQRITTVKVFDQPIGNGGSVVGTGYALRNPRDKFNEEVGCAIARARAFEELAANARKEAHRVRHEAGC